ncbi:MAG: aminotransferase class IV [Planctomycetales bacterium]|nr:aminotransferase class IV [Planctomycetales bacterium]
MQIWGNASADSSEMPSLSVDDIGLVSGVVIVDRLRTIAGKLLDASEHLERFQQGCRAVGIELPSAEELHNRALECAERGYKGYGGDDFNLVLLATPGRLHVRERQPTLIMHTQSIAWERLAQWYRVGQTLTVSKFRNVPESCWSPKIKTRARLHYYLADQQAWARTRDPYSAGLLLDQHGFVTETSSANVLIVERGCLISPRREMILDGVSLGRTLRLAERRTIEVRFEDISVDRATAADAMWLCGSTGCFWKAQRLDEREYGGGQAENLFMQLVDDWKQDVGIDFVEQAMQCTRV